MALDVKEIAKKMGPKYEREIEQAASEADTNHGLQVQTGGPLSSFNANCYPLCFTEFFYGDCTPGLERPAPLTSKQVFAYPMVREELDYSLHDDAAPYTAKALNR